MNIYKINAAENYLKTLAQFVLSENSDDFTALANSTILLPTKRACLYLKAQFCDLAANKTAILPKIFSIGELDEDELNLNNFLNFDEAIQVKQAISNEKRLLITAELIRESKDLQIDNQLINFEQSIKLAKNLLSLIDDFERYQIPFKNITNILPDELANHKQKTISFLTYFFDKYTEILNNFNLSDQISRRNFLLSKFVNNFIKTKPKINNFYIFYLHI
jgi:ATP-dependent helicase/nuclease subunit B